MYDLKLANGDIVLRGDGDVSKITGAERIQQELACWILEPLGTDRYYKKFGSVLGDYIGEPSFDDVLLDIRAEVSRVVGNYITYQNQQIEAIKEMSVQNALDAWNDDEVVDSVVGIDVSAVADTVRVEVKLHTVKGSTIIVTTTL